jgi:hypothetical protein
VGVAAAAAAVVGVAAAAAAVGAAAAGAVVGAAASGAAVLVGAAAGALVAAGACVGAGAWVGATTGAVVGGAAGWLEHAASSGSALTPAKSAATRSIPRRLTVRVLDSGIILFPRCAYLGKWPPKLAYKRRFRIPRAPIVSTLGPNVKNA